MNKNSEQFLKASERVKNLKKNPNDEELLELYGLYKQATIGNNNIVKPPFIKMKECKKWEAWNSKKDLSIYDSEVKYIKLVNLLINKYDKE